MAWQFPCKTVSTKYGLQKQACVTDAEDFKFYITEIEFRNKVTAATYHYDVNEMLDDAFYQRRKKGFERAT